MTQDSLFAADPEVTDWLTPKSPMEARACIAGDSSVKASVAEGEDFPLYDSEDTRVRLFKTIKDASTYLKRRVEALEEMGYKQSHGTLSRGTLVYTHPGTAGQEATVGLVLDRVPKRETKQS